MSNDALIATAKRTVQAYSDKDWNALWYSVIPDIIYEEVSTRKYMRGIKQYIACMQEWSLAFPDSKARIRHAFAFGDIVFLELSWEGTHLGPMESPGGTIYATGKKVEVAAGMVIEVLGDQVKTITHYFDVGSLEKQLEVPAEERIA